MKYNGEGRATFPVFLQRTNASRRSGRRRLRQRACPSVCLSVRLSVCRSVVHGRTPLLRLKRLFCAIKNWKPSDSFCPQRQFAGLLPPEIRIFMKYSSLWIPKGPEPSGFRLRPARKNYTAETRIGSCIIRYESCDSAYPTEANNRYILVSDVARLKYGPYAVQ